MTTKNVVLLTSDEASAALVDALNAASRALTPRLPYSTVAALLRGRSTRRKLTKREQNALRQFKVAVRRVRLAGHGGQVDDEVEGFLSALEQDRDFIAA